MTDDELNTLKLSYEERWARWNGRIVVIEKIFRGRGINNDIPRAKVMDDSKVRYLNFYEIAPF